MNSIPAERQNLFPRETEVTCAATSANGAWLVTSEYRYDKINYPEEKLKFWALQSNATTRFKLNTCVNLSHGGCKVAALALNDKGEFCVSSGSDQKIRIWKRDVSQQGGKRIYWHCLTACYYSSGVASILSDQTLNKFKSGENVQSGDTENLPYMKWPGKTRDVVDKIFNIHKAVKVKDVNDNLIGGIAISQDGSLIAAWFGVKLTLWDSHLCNLRTTLSHPALRPKGEYVRFGNNDAAHYVSFIFFSLFFWIFFLFIVRNPTTPHICYISNNGFWWKVFIVNIVQLKDYIIVNLRQQYNIHYLVPELPTQNSKIH